MTILQEYIGVKKKCITVDIAWIKYGAHFQLATIYHQFQVVRLFKISVLIPQPFQ